MSADQQKDIKNSKRYVELARSALDDVSSPMRGDSPEYAKVQQIRTALGTAHLELTRLAARLSLIEDGIDPDGDIVVGRDKP